MHNIELILESVVTEARPIKSKFLDPTEIIDPNKVKELDKKIEDLEDKEYNLHLQTLDYQERVFDKQLETYGDKYKDSSMYRKVAQALEKTKKDAERVKAIKNKEKTVPVTKPEQPASPEENKIEAIKAADMRELPDATNINDVVQKDIEAKPDLVKPEKVDGAQTDISAIQTNEPPPKAEYVPPGEPAAEFKPADKVETPPQPQPQSGIVPPSTTSTANPVSQTQTISVPKTKADKLLGGNKPEKAKKQPLKVAPTPEPVAQAARNIEKPPMPTEPPKPIVPEVKPQAATPVTPPTAPPAETSEDALSAEDEQKIVGNENTMRLLNNMLKMSKPAAEKSLENFKTKEDEKDESAKSPLLYLSLAQALELAKKHKPTPTPTTQTIQELFISES